MQLLLSRLINLKTLSILFIIFIAFWLFSTKILAQDNNNSQYLNVSQNINSDLSPSQKRDVDYVKNITIGLNQLLVGDPQKVRSAVVSGNTDQIYASTGALGSMTYLMSQMYTQMPISGVQYLADLGGKAGFVQEAHAQATGADYLKPIQQLWQVVRNLAYLGFVLIFIITGLMIMFRARIDPRTVASISDSLPRIVIALVLVTFSYALAGLMIDMVGISNKLIANVFSFAAGPGNFDDLFTNLETGKNNVFDLMKSVIRPGLFSSKWGDVLAEILDEIPILGSLTSIPGADKFLGGIFSLILQIAIVFSMFRVFVMLLTSVVTIILLTIFSPLQILVSALPGRGGALSSWAKGMLSAALVFPVTFTMLLLAAIFAKTATAPWNISTSAFTNPWTWYPVPLGGGIITGVTNANPPVTVIPGVEIMSVLIAIGILLTTPQAANIVKEALQQRPAAWGGAAGQELQGAARRIIPFF